MLGSFFYEMDKCKRCGDCCWLNGQPCENLKRKGNRFFCKIYGRHEGIRKTVIGEEFNCILIKEAIKKGFFSSRCGYVYLTDRR